MPIYRFFCDESYDSDPRSGTPITISDAKGKLVVIPKTFVVGGFMAHEFTWTEINGRWNAENKRAGVTRYHAAEVNARTNEFQSWKKDDQIRYSKNLLKILRDQGHGLHAISIAMHAQEYYRIVNDLGREKLGHPYLACFKSCITTIATQMNDPAFPIGDKFGVVLDRNPFQDEAIRLFEQLKTDRSWPCRHRLDTCIARGSDEYTALQCADLIAYETFRLVQERDTSAEVRKGLQSLFEKNAFLGYAFDAPTFEKMKSTLESATCAPDGFVVIFPRVES